MQKIWRSWTTIILIFICCMLSGCGLHMRSAANIPMPLHTLYLNSSNPDDIFSNNLHDLLVGLKIRMVNSPEQAPYGLYIIKSNLTTKQPKITNTNLANSIAVYFNVTVEIKNAHQQIIIGPRNFSLSSSQILNTNQVYTTNVDTNVAEQLQQQMTTLIYNWLTSTEVSDAINFKKRKSTTK